MSTVEIVDLLEASGTSTGECFVAGQAEVAATTIVVPTAVSPSGWLPLWVQCVDVHGEVEFVADDLLVLACELVGTVDALGVPVSPVQTVLKDSDGKGMGQPLADDRFPVAPIQIGSLDHMMLGIHPVHSVASVVDGQPVWPKEVGVSNDPAIGAVHVGVLNPRSVAPVGPVDLPFDWVESYGSWFLHVLPQEHLPVSAIYVGDLDARCARVCPVQLVMDPVNCQTTWTLKACRHHLLNIAPVQVGLHDPVQGDV